ncbi:MAG: helix-turn-helix domain-containing protein [Anaerolineae bacterium]|nr:helix-turn-helix domain-containing protein [Anaerolineae bacterium]
MAEGLGLWLRRAREVRKLSLDEVESALRIRRRYLQALEMGDYAALPGEIQARGFLRNYARFLGLPSEEALARYEAELAGHPMQPRVHQVVDEARGQSVERPTVFAPPPTEEEERLTAPGVPRGLLQVLLGAMLVFALIAGGGYLYLLFFADLDVSLATPVPTQEVVSPATEAPVVEVSPSADFVPATDGTVTVRLAPQQHVWVRLVADDEVVFQGIAVPGQTLEAVASTSSLVETGNGGAFTLVVNGVEWGLLGVEGEVVRRAWSPEGELSVQGP